MLKKIANSVLAASVALTPIGASASEQFMFRYKAPVQSISLTPPPSEDVEYGIGNDIVAYYVAPVGYDFAKKIPVATQDVFEWRRDLSMDDIPGGIALDTESGMFSGIPAAEENRSTLFHGYDRAGNRIARAEIHFNVFEPVGVPAVVDYYTHTNTYFYEEIPQPEGVTVHTWVPVDGVAYPDGMSMMNGAFQGTPAAAGSIGLAWRGYDYMGREVAFAYGEIVVADGPFVEELLADGSTRTDFFDQTRDKAKDESFSLSATVKKSLGPVTYRLVPETTRPGGLTFSSSGGALGGVFADYDTSATFRIEARDSFDGTTGLSDPFTLTTLPSVADIGTLGNLSGTVGTRYEKRLSSSGLVPGAKWELTQGSLPAGLSLDSKTGTISGTPTETGTSSGIVIRVSGPGMIPDESSAIDFRIYPEEIEATTEELHVRTQTPFATKGISITKGTTGDYSTGTTRTLPLDLAVDGKTGVVSSATGFLTAGDYDLPLYVDNGRRATFWQILRAYNPLEVSYSDIEVTRHESRSAFADVAKDSVIGKSTFSITDTDGDPIPDWLRLDANTGRINVAPTSPDTADVTFGPYVVTISDNKDSEESAPFNVKVNDRAPITISINDRDVERFIDNGYRIASQQSGRGAVTYSVETLPSNWPSTLKIREDGWLVGTTTDPVGTVYSGIVIKASDTDASSASSQPFDLTVREPDGLGGLYGWLNMSLEWTAGEALSGKLPPLRNSFGQVTYAFGQSVGVDITDSSSGAFAGTIATPGNLSATFTIDDETDRAPASGTLSLRINDRPEFNAPAAYDLNRAASFDTRPEFSGGTKPITFSLSGTLPQGISHSGGRIWGTPLEEGTFPVTITATDKAGATATASFDLRVGAPLPFELSYDQGNFNYGQWGIRFSRKKNAMGSVTYQAAAGTIPPGLSFNSTEGYFSGTPTETGRFGSVTVNAVDGEGRPATATLDMNVTRAGDVEFPDVTYKHRKGMTFTDTLTAGNVVDPVTFHSGDADGMPHGLVLNGQTGTITGSFPEEGSFTAPVRVNDDFDRTATAVVTFEIIGDMSVSIPDASLKQYMAAEATPEAVVVNATGPTTFALASGTLPSGLDIDPATGAVTGTTETAGIFPGITISATDPDGTTVTSGEFTVTVAEREPLVVEAPAAMSLKRFGTATFSATATAAIPPVAYDVTPDLPAGLVLDRDTGSITGTSEEIVAETVYTLTATDAKGGELGTDVAQFTLSVAERDPVVLEGPEMVEFTRYSEGTASYVAQSAIGSVTYSIAPDLPEGFTFDAVTATISGTSEASAAASPYVITAVDEKGGEAGTATLTVMLSVKERAPLGVSGPDSHEFTQHAPGSISFSTSDAIGDVVYSIAPALPAGLSLDETSGTISGASDVASLPAEFTVTAVDEKGGELGTSSKTFMLSVKERAPIGIEGPEAHEFEQYVTDTISFSTVDAIGDTVFSITPPLPEGLSLDPASGAISGAVEAIIEPTTYTVTAVDSKGGTLGTTTKLLTLSVKERTPLSLAGADSHEFAQYVAGSTGFTPGNAIGDVTYSISPALPDGLVLDEATGEIAGTADVSMAPAAYTVTAVDSKGGELGTATRTIMLSVTERPRLQASMPEVTAKRYEQTPAASAAIAPDTAFGTVEFSLSPDLPEGMTFDPATGTIAGVPAVPMATTSYTLTATDAIGGTLGTTVVQFNITVADRDPLLIEGPSSYAFAQHFEGEASYTAPAAIGATTFSVEPELPEGIMLDAATGRLHGMSSIRIAPESFTLTATDAHDTTTKTISIEVGDRKPLEFSTPAQQAVIMSHDIPVKLQLANIVGENVTWELVSGSAPEGMSFDASTGTFTGAPTEYGSTSSATVRASDDFEGTAIRTFSFKVLQDGTPITLSLEAATTRVGSPFTIAPPSVDNIVGTQEWSVEAQETGLVIDRETGQLSGTPRSVFGPTDIAVTVKDVTGREATATVTVTAVAPMTVTAPESIDLVFSRDVPAGIAATVTDNVGAVAWAMSGRLPEGVSIDPSTGTLKGIPTELGAFPGITVTATDTLPGAASSKPITINVAMNEDPLELVVKDFATKIGLEISTEPPTYSNNVGSVTFFSGDLAGTGLSIDATTGVITGTASTLMDTYINVSVRDSGTLRVTSKPMRLRVLPPMQITVPAQVMLTALTDINPVRATRNYIVEPAEWEPIDESVNALPEGITFDTTTGTFKGNAKELGTYGPFEVASTDAAGDRGVSNSFVIKVNPGAFFLGLAKAEQLPDGVKRLEEYSYDFRQHLTTVGMDESELTWSLGPNSPPGLTLENGLLSGTPSLSGLYTFDIKVTFGSVSATRSYTMEVKLPDTELTLAGATLPPAKRRASNADNSWTFDFGSLVTSRNLPEEAITFAIEPFSQGEALPAGLTLGSDGVLSGTADAEPGTYTFRVAARFQDSSDESISSVRAFEIVLTDEIAFAFNEATLATAMKRLAYNFDLKALIDDASLQGLTKNNLSWSWKVDPDRNPETTLATLPAGLSISGGALRGTPTNSGSYSVVLTAAFDGRTRSKTFPLQSSLQSIGLSLAAGELPKGEAETPYTSVDLKSKLTATNIPVAAVKWTLSTDVTLGSGEYSGLPDGITLSDQGVLSGTPTLGGGTFRFKVTATWEDKNAVAETASAQAVYTLTVDRKTYRFTKIETGDRFACGLSPAGKVLCWGYNNLGTLGGSVGTTENDNGADPDLVEPLNLPAVMKDLWAGQSSACAQASDNKVYCWGRTFLGDGTPIPSNNGYTPRAVAALAGVKSMSIGDLNSCAVSSANNLLCWGLTSNGLIGNGSESGNPINYPVEIPLLNGKTKQVSVAQHYACAVSTDGGLYCWGRKDKPLGMSPAPSSNLRTPTLVPGMETGVASVAVGNWHACATMETGKIKCWGTNDKGNLGTGSGGSSLVPVDVAGISQGATAVTVTRFLYQSNYFTPQSCAVVSGKLKCWGTGVTGTMTSTNRSPVDISVPGGLATNISLGHMNGCVTTPTDEGYCWGSNSSYELGNGKTTHSVPPVRVTGR